MLKLFLSIYSIVLIGTIGFSQTTQEKVINFLGYERFNKIESSNPGLIEFLEMKVEKGYHLIESVDAKKSSYIKVNHVFYKKEEISIEDFLEALNQDSFNFLNYSFPNQDSNVTTHYLLGDSGLLISVYSNAVINNKIASSN